MKLEFSEILPMETVPLLEIVFACMHSAWKRLRIRSWSYMWIMCVMRSVEEKDMGEVFCWRRI
jgi:hypothetical protein